MTPITTKQRQPSFTKAGPGRRHVQGDGTGRNKTLKQRMAGAFGKGLRNAITRKQKAALELRAAKA